MKKFMLIGLIVALIFVVVGGAGLVVAQVRGIDNPVNVTVNTTRDGNKIIRQFNVGPGGMMGQDGYYYGPGGMMRGYGPGGMMGGFGPGGMMGGRACAFLLGAGTMHDYVISAFASAVNLNVDEVNTRLANGETLKEIAIAQGTAEADLPALAQKVAQAALDKAVADGVITQAQADLMLERMKNKIGFGFSKGLGFDNCPMWDSDELP